MSIDATAPATKVILGCSKCGSVLPDEAQFCLKCGKPVSIPMKQSVVIGPTLMLVQPRRAPRIFLWVLLGLLLGVVTWVAISDDPFAQGLQEVVGWKHDQTILETPFGVSAHSFRFYKFSLPEGSVHVSILGQFAATSDKKAAKSKDKNNADEPDNDVEVYVLSEPAFAVWQNGYATSSVYESGRVSKGEMQAELPAGAGVYYLIFSNKFTIRNAKNINATVLLRYKSWVPDWFRIMKARMWNWIGL